MNNIQAIDKTKLVVRPRMPPEVPKLHQPYWPHRP